MSSSFTFQEEEKSDVGSLLEMLNRLMATFLPLLGQCSLLVNGNKLCQILSECENDVEPEKEKKASSSVTMFSIEGVMSLLFYCSNITAVFLPLVSIGFVPNDMVAYAVVQSFHHSALVGSMMLTTMLFRELLSITSRKISVDFLLEESFLRRGVAGPDPRLDTLERTIRKVSIFINN